MISHAPLMLAGLVLGLGVWVLVREWIPTQPRLADAVERLAPTNLRLHTAPTREEPGGFRDRLGQSMERRLAGLPGLSPPRKDMDLLGLDAQSVYSRKLTTALAGLALPVLLGVLLRIAGIGLNLTIPAGFGLALGALGWLLPDARMKERAAAARKEFVRASVAYLQLVAIQRTAGAGATAAMTGAAELSDAWTFRRIRQEIARAEWAHIPPWDALATLGEQIGVTQLADVGDIMRMAGETGAGVSESLLARATSLRDQLLSEEHSKANEATTAMTAPGSMLLVVFLAALFYPVSIVLLG